MNNMKFHINRTGRTMVAFTSVCFRICDMSPVHVAGKTATGREEDAAEAGG